MGYIAVYWGFCQGAGCLGGAVYNFGASASVTARGYNVSDKAPVTGTTVGSGSGYAAGTTGDLFDVTDISCATPGDPATAGAVSAD